MNCIFLIVLRQASFLRKSVFLPSDPDNGTGGLLRAEVISARNLRNADIIGASDPYVVVTLGLQSAKTHAIQALGNALDFGKCPKGEPLITLVCWVTVVTLY